MNQSAVCELCGEPMPDGEEMFKYHGYSGPCPKPPMCKVCGGHFDHGIVKDGACEACRHNSLKRTECEFSRDNFRVGKSMNKSEIAEKARQFYEQNATNVVNVPRPGHPEDKSGWDGVRRASQAKFVAQDALVMTLPDAFDFAAKFGERAIAESQAPQNLSSSPEARKKSALSSVHNAEAGLRPSAESAEMVSIPSRTVESCSNSELGDGEPSPPSASLHSLMAEFCETRVISRTGTKEALSFAQFVRQRDADSAMIAAQLPGPEYRCASCGEFLEIGPQDETVIHFKVCKCRSGAAQEVSPPSRPDCELLSSPESELAFDDELNPDEETVRTLKEDNIEMYGQIEKLEGDTGELKAALRQLMHCVEKGDKGWTLGDQLSLAKAYAKAERLAGPD
jgi:hypothetical protein